MPRAQLLTPPQRVAMRYDRYVAGLTPAPQRRALQALNCSPLASPRLRLLRAALVRALRNGGA